MDPKMDSGFLEPHELLYDTYDVLQNLLPEEVIGIMDQLLCYEVRLSATSTNGMLTGSSDGLAPGLPALTNAIHLPLH